MTTPSASGNASSNLVFWGGYGGYNLGDEAILYAAKKLLSPTNRARLVLRGIVPAHICRLYEEWGLDILPMRRPWKLLAGLTRAQLVVGGGQMVDEGGWGWPTGYSSALIAVTRLLFGDARCVGIGAEPLRGLWPRLMVKRFYSLCDDIAVRDDASAQAIAAVVDGRVSIRTTADLVFSLTAADLPPRSAVADHLTRIAIVPNCDLKRSRSDSKALFDFVHQLLTARDDVLVTIFPHDLRQDYDAGEVHRWQAHSCHHDRLQFAFPALLPEVLTLYSKTDIVISPRMHPLILGALCGAVPIGIAVSSKVRSACKLMSALIIEPEKLHESVPSVPSKNTPEIERTLENVRLALCALQRKSRENAYIGGTVKIEPRRYLETSMDLDR